MNPCEQLLVTIALLYLVARIFLRLIRFALDALLLYALFVIVALATALLCVGSGHHGEFVRAAIVGLTGGQ